MKYIHSSGRKRKLCFSLKTLAVIEFLILGFLIFAGIKYLGFRSFLRSKDKVKQEYIDVVVSGSSMEPAFHSGERVRALKDAEIKKGDAVVARFGQGYIIKRVRDLRDGEVFLAGDNEESIDSRTYGWIDRNLIIGKIEAR